VAERLLFSDTATAARFCTAVGLEVVDNAVLIPRVTFFSPSLPTLL
jgi:hypothetical protein